MVLGAGPHAYQLWFFGVCWWKSAVPRRIATAESCQWMTCKQRRCVWCGAMYDSQWACISRWLTGSLSPSSRRTTEAFYPHTYPPADSLFMLCGLAMDLWQDQRSGSYSDCPKERQMEASGLAPDSPCTHLITATSYQRTLICQLHTTYSSSSSLCFFPLSRSIH